MKKQKIPAPIIGFLVLLIVFVVILLALVVPTLTKVSDYNAEHATISSQIDEYDEVLADQANVEAKIEEMQNQYKENQENLYVDSKSSVQDLQDIFAQLGIEMNTLTRGDSVQDPQGRTSNGGIPLYYTNLSFSYNGTKEETIKLVHYLEQESKGCYFIDSLTMSPLEESSDLSVSFAVTLYYFDSTKQVATTASTDPTATT